MRELHAFFGGLTNRQERFNEENMAFQEYGFTAYSRKAFDQQKKYNSDAVTDFFNNPERRQLEERVIEYLER